MILNEVLVEKYRTQKRLSEGSNGMHDYFQKAKASSKKLSEKYNFDLKYEKLPNKNKSTQRKGVKPIL